MSHKAKHLSDFDHSCVCCTVKGGSRATDTTLSISCDILPGRCHTHQVWPQASEERAGSFFLQNQSEKFKNTKEIGHFDFTITTTDTVKMPIKQIDPRPP